MLAAPICTDICRIAVFQAGESGGIPGNCANPVIIATTATGSRASMRMNAPCVYTDPSPRVKASISKSTRGGVEREREMDNGGVRRIAEQARLSGFVMADASYSLSAQGRVSTRDDDTRR